MKRTTFLVLIMALVAIISAAGCSTRISSELFFRDLSDIPDGDLTNKIVFHLPLPSMDKCEEYRGRYDTVFEKSRDFKSMQFVKCADEDFSDYVEYEMDVPLRMIDPEKIDVEGAVEFIRWDDPDLDGNRFVIIRTNPPSLADLDDLLKDEFFQGLDLTDSSPLVRLSNDLRSDQVFMVWHAFVQNQPVIEPTSFTLEPRDSIDIVLSDVTSAYIFHVSKTEEPRTAPIGIWVIRGGEEN